MSMFNTQSSEPYEFLKKLENDIDFDEFTELAAMAGFSDPNNFPIEKITNILETKSFPTEDHYEFLWAIYECGRDELTHMSCPMRIYLASLYVYCNKIYLWGTAIESDYYLIMLNAAIESESGEYETLLCFVEWLHDYVQPDEGHDDYFCLLTWIFLQRKARLTNRFEFQKVLTFLEAKQYTQQQLDELTVSDNWRENWLGLSDSLPVVYDVEAERYTKIIYGPG